MAAADVTRVRTPATAVSWGRALCAGLLAMTAGPLVAGMLLVILWAALTTVGVTPVTGTGERSVLGALPGGGTVWDWIGSLVFALLVCVDALVRVRCVRAVAGVGFRPVPALVCVAAAPGLWVWLDGAQAAPVLLLSAVVMTAAVRFASTPATAWRPSDRIVRAAALLLAAAALAAWKATGTGLVPGDGTRSDVHFVPAGIYHTATPLDYDHLRWGRQKPTVALYRFQLTNASLFPITVTSIDVATSGGLLKPIPITESTRIGREQSLLLSARMRIRSCHSRPGTTSAVRAVLVTYRALGLERTQRVVPEQPLAITCPAHHA